MGSLNIWKQYETNLISKKEKKKQWQKSNRWGRLAKVPETELFHLGHAPVGQTAFLPNNITLAFFFCELKKRSQSESWELCFIW